MTRRQLAYYPGCTLKTTAKNFDTSALEMAKALDIELVELDRWYCCGTVYSLATDDVIHQLAPIRNLVRAQEQGYDTVVTLCSMCYNTLVRANHLFATDEDRREKILAIMDREVEYSGDMRVRHLLEVLSDEIGFDAIEKRLTRQLKKLNLAPYYGCLLVRPREAAIDDVEAPTVMHRLLDALGAATITTPYMTECCGSYQTVKQKELVAQRGYKIIDAARSRGADALVTSCPLCHFNLDRRQENIAKRYKGFEPMPIFYFTQLMALAFGLSEEVCRFDLHYVDPRPLLRTRSIATGASEELAEVAQ